jgi:hypothetical protein
MQQGDTVAEDFPRPAAGAGLRSELRHYRFFDQRIKAHSPWGAPGKADRALLRSRFNATEGRRIDRAEPRALPPLEPLTAGIRTNGAPIKYRFAIDRRVRPF